MQEKHTVESAAKRLSELAQLTANNSRNWEAFESIAYDMIQAAYNAGKAARGD